MKKYILALPIMVFMIASVFAFDFSVSGNKIIKSDGSVYISKTNLWHDDGRVPTCSPYQWYNHNGVITHCSNGLAPQGQGDVMLSLSTPTFRGTANVHLTEKSSRFVGNKAYITSIGRAVIWNKGTLPMQITIDNILYVYDKNAGTTTFSSTDYPGETVTIPVNPLK